MDLKFDTRHKKPTVWNVAFLSAAAVAALYFLLRAGSPRGPFLANVLTAVYCAAVIAMLTAAFFRQLQYNPYSYNTIYYAGFALFVFSVFITHVFTAVRCFMQPELFDQRHLFLTLLHSAKRYLMISSPFLLAFSAALFVSNVSLIRHEGKRFVNTLGILLSVLLVSGEAAVWLLDRLSGETMVTELIVSLAAAAYLYFECMLIGAMIADAIAARHEPHKDKAVIIVLGCGIRKDGTPTPILRGRLDRTLAFAARQAEEKGPEPVFVVSGGQGPNEVVSEAASMRAYLLSQGVPDERIITEDRSTDTAENMRFSKELIEAARIKGHVAYATTNYHVFRAGLKARRVKMRAVGMGAPTRWYFWPNAAVREFVGLLTEHRGKQALVILFMTAAYTALALLSYR
ncbi:MAG: YdcF family protein [Oscillospiraceae bacterium]|nr:YdcF family protein [Oscillospiraceae bacterium]